MCLCRMRRIHLQCEGNTNVGMTAAHTASRKGKAWGYRQGGCEWVGELAYDPNELGPSSPQRSPQPIAQEDEGCAKIAQWAERLKFFSTRVVVRGLLTGQDGKSGQIIGLRWASRARLDPLL